MRLNHPHKNIRQPQGFTLIELLFAMTAFSIMLVVAVSGLLNAMAIYNQANVSRDNQQQVRSIVEQVGRDIRAASKATVLSDGSLCLEGTTSGNIRYYQAVVGTGPAKHLKRVGLGGDCTAFANPFVPSLPYIAGSEKDLMSGGSATTVSVFEAKVLQQNPTDPKAESVRITFGMVRGAGAPASVRERQFSNEYKLTSAFMVGVR